MRAVIAAERPTDREKYRVAALGVGLECRANDCVPATELQARLAREPAADLVLVAMSDPADAPLAALGHASMVARTVALAVGPVSDAVLIHKASGAGARRYLDEDRLQEQLTAALDSLSKEGAVTLRRGKVIAVCSAQPGSGVTTTAAALAFALAAEKKGSVALAEPGTGVPELALDLNATPANGLDQLLRLSERADASMARAAAVEHPAGVAVLAYPAETLVPEYVTAEQAKRLVTVLRAGYDWVVLDLGHGLTDGNVEFVHHADRVVVVTRQDVPAVRLTRRFLKGLAIAPAERLVLLANRYGQAGHLAWKKVEDALKVPVKEWLPDDPSGVNAALTAGEPVAVAARGSGLNKAAGKLVKALTAELTAVKK
jgi:pilus assembly protein CpaE